MDEDFIDVTKSNNKLIALALAGIILGLTVFGYFFVYQKHHFSLKTVTIELGSELSHDVNDYLKENVVDTSGYKININSVDVDVVGTYEYSITYNKRKLVGKIKVVDTKAPVYTIKDVYKVEVDDDDFFLGDVLSSCEDASMPCIVTFKNTNDESKLKTIGKYDIDIIVSDIYNNKSNGTAKIEVVEKGSIVREEEADLSFDKSSSELPGFKDEYYIKLEKAIKADSDESTTLKSEITVDSIDEFVKNNYSSNTIKDSEIVEMYNKYGYVIGYVIKITLNNDKVVYMTRDTKSNE